MSIFAFMFSTGLNTRITDLSYLRLRSDVGLLIGSILAIDVLVPLVALAVILLVQPPDATGIGLLLLASAPVAPMALKRIRKARGAVEYAVSLHLALATLAIVSTPITLAFLSWASGYAMAVPPLAVAGRVGVSILLPLIAGMVFRQLFPALADLIASPLETMSGVTLALVSLVLLLSTYHLLFTLDARSYIAMVLLIAGALAAGHLLTPGRREERTTLALESASRNIGLALLIASTLATLEMALPVLVTYVILFMIIGFLYVRYVKMVDRSRFHPSSR